MRGVEITFNNFTFHTGRDFDLVQEIKKIGKPEVQSALVAVPGRNGLLNLTSGLTGRVCYYNREIDLRYFASGPRSALLEIERVFNRLHGQRIEIIDDDTPTYKYVGECVIDVNYYPGYMLIDLIISADPFMVAINDTSVRVSVNGTAKDIRIQNDGAAVVPTVVIPSGSSLVIKKGDKTLELSPGEYTIDDLELEPGDNLYNVRGSGSFTIKYKEARL